MTNKISVQPGIVLLEKRYKKEEQLASGIIVQRSEQYQDTTGDAWITEIHEETAREHGLEVGMHVFVNPYALRELQLDATTKRYAVAAGDVMAILETEALSSESCDN